MVHDPRKDAAMRLSYRIPIAAEYSNQFLGGLTSNSEVVKNIATQTGVLSLDLALGGGVHSGVTEIFGKESSGKTALGASILRRSQELGLSVMLCAGELVDVGYLENIGVDLKNLALTRGHLDFALEAVADFLFETQRVVVIDSLTSLRSVVDTFEVRDRILRGFFEEMRSSISIGSALVVINQVRAKKSMDSTRMFTGKLESSERWMTEFFDTRLEVSREDVSEDSYSMRVLIERGIEARPGTSVNIPVVKGHGINMELDRLYAALSTGIIERRGSNYFLGPVRLGAGEVAASAALKSPRMAESIRSKLFERYKLG